MFDKLIAWNKKRKDDKFIKRYFYEVKISREQLIESLKTLKVHASHSGVPERAGICGNVQYYLITEHNLFYATAVKSCCVLCDLFQGWKHHSGRWAWPIKEYDRYSWTGESLRLRLDLIDYTINRLEKMR